MPIFYLQIKILNRVYVLSFIKLQLVKNLFTVTTAAPGAPSLKDGWREFERHVTRFDDMWEGLFKVDRKLILHTAVKLREKSH